MKPCFILPLLLPALIPLIAAASVQARGNDFTISDGQGEMLQVKNPLFGKKLRVVKDRLGDGFAQQQGLLGSRDSEYSVLGNKLAHHKGILGNTEISGNTIFGDKFVTKRGIFGRRTTAIDISGSSKLIKSLIGHQNGMPAYPSYNGTAANLAPSLIPAGASPLTPVPLSQSPSGN